MTSVEDDGGPKGLSTLYGVLMLCVVLRRWSDSFENFLKDWSNDAGGRVAQPRQIAMASRNDNYEFCGLSAGTYDALELSVNGCDDMLQR